MGSKLLPTLSLLRGTQIEQAEVEAEVADTTKSSEATAAGQAPGGGRQDHDVMRDAAMRAVTGGASSDNVAAAGGLEVPGREPHSTAALADRLPHRPEASLIPGERDASTLTHREAGAVSGQFAGADIPAGPDETMDERTARERAREGGGVEGERAFDSHR